MADSPISYCQWIDSKGNPTPYFYRFIQSIWENNGSFSGTTPVTSGGTGLGSIAADKILYTSAANTFSPAGLTAFSRTLLDDTTANEWLTTLTATRAESGAVAVTALNKLRERVSVIDFGAVGNGTTDDTAAIQAAIDALGTSGGTVHFPFGTFKITSSLVVGNGTTGNVFSTLGAVKLVGSGSVVYGEYGAGGTTIHNYANARAIIFSGPQVGWGLEEIAIVGKTTNTATGGLLFNESQYGTLKNVSISGCYGIAFETTTYGSNNMSHNVFERLSIFLPAGGTTNATVGIKLTGTGTTNDTANNCFLSTFIQPTSVNQIPLWLQYADTNTFFDTDLNPIDAIGTSVTKGIYFDYSYQDPFPNANTFFMLDLTAHKVALNGTPSAFALRTPNEIYGLSKANSALIPDVSGLPLVIDNLKLFQNTTFYVATTGSDTTGDGTSTKPWLTIQTAWDKINKFYELNGYTATINLADGTYSGALSVTTPVVNGYISINGNSGDVTAVTLSNTSIAVYASKAHLTIKDLTMSGATVAELFADNGGFIQFSNIKFGAAGAGGIHLWAQHGGRIEATGNYAISGGAVNHIYALGGTVRVDSKTVTITNTPAFSGYYAQASFNSLVEIYSNTFSGSATGTRYLASLNGVIDTRGGIATYLPGDVAGSTASGGQYDISGEVANIDSGTIDGTTQATGTINGSIAVGGTWTAAATLTLPAYTLGGTVTANSQSVSGVLNFTNGLALASGTTLATYIEGTATPTITAGTGSFTTVSCVQKNTKIGRVVVCQFNITITTNNTAASYIKMPLAYNNGATYDACGSYRDYGSTGIMGQVYVAAAETYAAIFKYENSYPGADGVAIGGTVTYSV